MQSENMKKHQENRLKEKKRELSQHYGESQEENEHFADVGFSSKNQEICDSSTTLYQGTAGLSSENKEDIKKTCVNEIEDVHESTNKSIASRSELNLLNELVLNKQETLDVLEAEILALKNEKSEFILEKEHLTNDMQEEYENSKKIQIEKDLLLKDIDELQLEADNIENDLDLLRTEKSKLCLELKGIKSDINERSVEFKKIQESLNMEVHGKKKGNVELDENLVLDVILSDFGCQVNMEDSTISHDSNNNNSVQVLANKKVGTDVLFSSIYVQVEEDFYSEKNFSDQQISTELQQSDFSCQTGNSVPNTDQPVQVKPLCSAKSVNTVSSIPSLLSTKDLSVQVNMKENIVLDAACQTMAMTELHNCSALDTKANSTNVLNVIASAKSELESKMNPLYHRLQLLEEAVCLKSNKNEENSGGGVDNNTKQQLDSEQLNSTFELLQDFNTSDQKLKSNAKQQHELLISTQGFKALCSYENPNSTDSKPYSTHKSIRDPRNAAILEYANASGSYTLAEASAILRYIQNQKSEELPCSSINEKILQQPIFQPSQEAPYGNIFQLEDTTISDSTKPQTCNAPVLENASESAAAKEDANLSEMYRLAEAFLHIYQKVNTQKEEKSNGWLSENEDQSRTGISPSQNTVQRSPYGNSLQFEVSVSTDSEKQQTSAVGNNPKSSAIDDINLSETCRLAEAFLQTCEQKNSQKKRLSNNWTKGGLFQESAAVPASQIAPQTSAYGHYYNYRETPSAGIFNDSTNSQVRNSDVSSRNDPKPAVDDTSLSEMYKSAEAFLHKRHMKHLRNDKLSNGWMNEHLSQTYIGMTREQNIPQVRNVQDYSFSKESPTTEFREIHSSQVFTTSSRGTSFTSFIEEWINNRNKELNVLTEIRKRLRLYGKCNF